MPTKTQKSTPITKQNQFQSETRKKSHSRAWNKDRKKPRESGGGRGGGEKLAGKVNGLDRPMSGTVPGILFAINVSTRPSQTRFHRAT